MDNIVYLLNLRVKGIKNIKDEVKLEFYKRNVDKNFNPERYRVKAIYGENGSGKSAIITAVKIFQDLIVNDNYLNESKTQKFLDEIINKEMEEFSFGCEFFVDVNVQKFVYSYQIIISKNAKGLYSIKEEILKVKKGNYINNNYKKIFETDKGELVYVISSGEEREKLIRNSINLLEMKSFINIYASNIIEQNQIKSEDTAMLTAAILIFMQFVMSIKVYLTEEDQHELYFLKRKMRESMVDAFSSVNEKMVYKKEFETYKRKIKQLTQFIKIFKKELVSIDIDAKENGDRYECDLNLNYGTYSINKEFESTGIKKLISLFDCFVFASEYGIVFIDEMDSNLNDIYLCKLIEYFMYYGHGQLCFTTHNLDPMHVLKENKNSIDFLSVDNRLISWTAKGNSSPAGYYRNGMIEDIPFNVDATDFIGILGE